MTLCDSMDYSPPGLTVHGILQAEVLEWVAMLSSRDLPITGMEPASLTSPALVGRFFTTSTTWEALTGVLGGKKKPRGMVWGGRREEGSGWGTCVYLWQIHVDIRQNQYNIVKLKNKIKKKRFLERVFFYLFSIQYRGH